MRILKWHSQLFTKNEAENHYITSFEGDSGYYWYWWSWNEHMGNEIGIIVDLYDNSEFDRSNINHFRRLFMDAKNDLIKRPPEFESHYRVERQGGRFSNKGEN